MRFLIEIIVRDNFEPANAQPTQKTVGETLGNIMKSGKVVTGGNYSDERGGFFIMDFDSAVEMKRLFHPIQDICKMTVHPFVSLEEGAALLQELASGSK